MSANNLVCCVCFLHVFCSLFIALQLFFVSIVAKSKNVYYTHTGDNLQWRGMKEISDQMRGTQ